MNDFLKSKEVKTKKPHICWGCTTLFPAGSVLTYVVAVDNGDFSSCYWCDKCIEIMSRENIHEDIEFGEFKEEQK